jgi:hypothetical protein
VTARAATLVILLLILAAHIRAQPAWDISGGYSYLHDPPDAIDFPAGWIAGASVGVTPWLSAIVDVSGHAATDLAIDFSTLAALAGVRASARVGPFTEFAQLVAGIVRSKSTVVGIESSDHNGSLQPGGGLEYPSGTRVAARLQFDYRQVLGGIETAIADPRHQFRYSIALVYRSR